MDYNCMTERFPSPAIPLSYKSYSHHPCPNSYTSISLTLSLDFNGNIQFFTGRMPFLSPNQQCQSTEGKYITFHGLAYPSQKKIH